MLGGIIWVLLLPLDQYSRQTYISENALLPGQVHTYFGGSEQNVFRAYKHELATVFPAEPVLGNTTKPTPSSFIELSDEGVGDKVEELFHNAGLKTGRQWYSYVSAGKKYIGENVYAVLHAPRGDGTEAIVIVAALKNIHGQDNINGVTLMISLARYFKRWSLWSKDIIFLVTPDSDTGPQAWIDAYHSTHDPTKINDLSLKSGALQGAVCIDYPFEHRFERLHVAYDGINGQLPNLDLVNTAISIASGQMGIGTMIQSMDKHSNDYPDRVRTLAKGMASQALGHATGPHSVFMPYHVDAITLTAMGEGWQDEMAFGRTVESICRSLNNLLEHLHQSFFFYLLMQSNRFVSIGTYLPSAMAIAAGFTLMAIHLWARSGYEQQSAKTATISATTSKAINIEDKSEAELEQEKARRSSAPFTATVKQVERHLGLPVAFTIIIHTISLLPLNLSTTLKSMAIPQTFFAVGAVTVLLPIIVAGALPEMPNNVTVPTFAAPTNNQYTLIRSINLLLLGLFLTVLATLNFSLSMILGLLCAPLAFVDRLPQSPQLARLEYLLLVVVSPSGVAAIAGVYMYSTTGDVEILPRVLERLAFGWNVWGSWGALIGIWAVWWPAWITSAVLVASSWYDDGQGNLKKEEGTTEKEGKKNK
jgi:GPI-anchor transamidase subunit GAA1